MKTVLVDWNLIPYAEAWQRQTEWFDTLVRAKAQGEAYENRIIMCEHPHVYTLGRSGKENNMLLNDDQLKAIQATLFHIDRGGDITYHGPGQLVCYPILNLEEFHLGLKEYVHLLEEAVIRVCASYGIEAALEDLTRADDLWRAVRYAIHHRVLAAVVHEDSSAGKQLRKVKTRRRVQMHCVAFRQARHVKIETTTSQSFRKDSKASAGCDSSVTEIGNNCIP